MSGGRPVASEAGPRVGGVRIATWNVNSIRSRVDRVAAWLERTDVDVLAIQETKAREDQFPYLP
ncbi:MAG TPA: endonuclease/exonuclease/phosphatase family protein, partial [Candidatus Lustribacter sp.]|nr:endonuclease/exonuclease/phosphatase family protein [Candidatus Lustribacter sp.]